MKMKNELEIPEPIFATIQIFSSDDTLLGNIFTETQFYDIRCQIKEKNLGAGYYFKYKNNKLRMNEYGQINRDDKKYDPFKYESYLNRLMQ